MKNKSSLFTLPLILLAAASQAQVTQNENQPVICIAAVKGDHSSLHQALNYVRDAVQGDLLIGVLEDFEFQVNLDAMIGSKKTRNSLHISVSNSGKELVLVESGFNAQSSDPIYPRYSTTLNLKTRKNNLNLSCYLTATFPQGEPYSQSNRQAFPVIKALEQINESVKR